MSTIDVIKIYGGEPTNLLDIRWSFNEHQNTDAIKFLNSDNDAKSIFLIILGGILTFYVLKYSILTAE